MNLTVCIRATDSSSTDDLHRTISSLAGTFAPPHEVVLLGGRAEGLDDRAGSAPLACAPLDVASVVNAALSAAGTLLVAIVTAGTVVHPSWPLDVTDLFEREPEVIAAGSTGHPGHDLVCDRLGRVTEVDYDPSLLNRPGSASVPALELDGLVLRVDEVRRIGGVDPFFTTPFGLADLAMRIVDGGFVIACAPAQVVYPGEVELARHRIAPAGASIDQVCFALRHGLGCYDGAYVFGQVAEWTRAHGHSAEALAGAMTHAHAPLPSALPAAPHPHRVGRWPEVRPRPERRLHLGFSLVEYPPGPVNGICRIGGIQAVALADAGHLVEVVTPTAHRRSLAWQDGVWVHRTPRLGQAPDRRMPVPMPTRNWDETASLRDALLDIHRAHPLDVVQVANWAGEGAALVAEDAFPTVMSLVTPLATVSDIDEGMRGAEIDQLIEVERWGYGAADAYLANGPSIVEEINARYEVELDPDRLGTVFYGLPDVTGGVQPLHSATGIDVLFVGRLEARKGIDTVLDAAPMLLRRFPDARVFIAGDDSLASPAGRTYRQMFEADPTTEDIRSRVVFLGRIGEDELLARYAGCDVFVAPSRFESFGLILVEAMMFAKPVVCGDVGGMRYIVDEGVSGFRCPPGDSAIFGERLAALLSDAALRAEMGRAGRRIYEDRFSPTRMVRDLEHFYQGVIDRFHPGVAE